MFPGDNMNDSIKLGVVTGALGVIAGFGMQSAVDPMIQVVGQGWMLGGLMGTALLSGFSIVSEKWRHYKEEADLNQKIENFQKSVSNSASIHRVDQMTPYIELVRAAATLFAESSNAKQESVVIRLQTLGVSLVDNMPTQKLRDSAVELVNRSMGYVRFKLDQTLYSDVSAKKAGNSIESLNSSPSIG